MFAKHLAPLLLCLPTALAAESNANAIALRCNGSLTHYAQVSLPLSSEEFETLQSRGELFTLPGSNYLTNPPFEVLRDPDFKSAPATRVFQIVPNQSVKSINVEIPFDKCKRSGFSLDSVICSDLLDAPGQIVDFNEIISIPPFYLSSSRIYASDFWKRNEDGKWLFATYSIEKFVSYDCERIDPMPDADVWFGRSE